MKNATALLLIGLGVFNLTAYADPLKNDSNATSYDNFKKINIAPQSLPFETHLVNARAYLDIDGDGEPELFAARSRYESNQTFETAAPSRFGFFKKQANGKYEPIADVLPTGSDGCITPRKAIVGDFNGDGKPDVFVACHGWDRPPFPGEHSQVVLSQPDGTYRIDDASVDVGFFHSAAAADFNNDGLLDVIVTNSTHQQSVQVWLNDGTGHFVRSRSYLPSSLKRQANYFTVEAVDVDGDGKFDLFIGGHEWEGAPTTVLINPGKNDFSGAKRILLPPVTGEGVVLDVVVTGQTASRALWVLRTSGGDGTFYKSTTVQRVSWPDLQSNVPVLQRYGKSISWIIPTRIDDQDYITSDNVLDRTIRISVESGVNKLN